ncbi:hypothetical protein GCM10018952_06220 [Streptosporangium vulgare]
MSLTRGRLSYLSETGGQSGRPAGRPGDGPGVRAGVRLAALNNPKPTVRPLSHTRTLIRAVLG